MTTDTTIPTATPPADMLGEQGQQEDYWGFEHKEKHVLPDGVSFFEIQAMNEGARSAFQKLNSQDMKINRRDDSASVRIDPAQERTALIVNSVVGWNLKKGGEEVLFSKVNLNKWLEVANPKIVDELEHACRLANPWLSAEMSVEDIQTEIDRLEELKIEKKKEEAGN